MTHAPTRPEDCALIVIDVQEKLLPVIDGHGAVLANCQRLARFAGLMNLPVLACRQRKLGQIVSPLAQALPPGLEAMEKTSFDCFGLAPFAGAVADLGRRTLVLVGIEAHICVMQTALGALAAGYAVQVAADAVGSRAAGNHALALERLRQAGALITSAEMFIYELLQRADRPEFAQVLPLVK